MLVLGIDPGSIKTGWALLKANGKKIHVVASGILEFNPKVDFLERLTEIRTASKNLFAELAPDEVAFESLIYVKSPQALIKLAQTRGMILSACVESHRGKIFEYSPNLVKSSAVGHGHADKESMRKFLDMTLGKRDYKSHDESDAVAIALCHIINSSRKSLNSSVSNSVAKTSVSKSVKKARSSKGSSSLAQALAHKVGKI